MDEHEIVKLVANSYDSMAEKYDSWRIIDKFNDLLEKFVSCLPKEGKILDAGIGSGIPSAKYLTDAGLKVTGIDISVIMLNMARRNVPEANLHKISITDVDKHFLKNTFDGIISVFTLFHIPRKLHGEIFKKFANILKQGGVLMINSGISESEGFNNFFDSPMFWSNYNPEKTLQLVREAGLHILYESELIRGGEQQYWVHAQKK